MHTICVQNFGPINRAEYNINDFTVMIGEQASGKSTLAKLVYYFRKFKNYYAVILTRETGETWTDVSKMFLSQMKEIFTNTFGTTHKLGNFQLGYFYNENDFITITPDATQYYLDIGFSQSLASKLSRMWEKTKNCTGNSDNGQEIVDRLSEIFDDEFSSIYIPAGRALLSRQSLLELIQTNELTIALRRRDYDMFDLIDAMTRDYMREVASMRTVLSRVNHADMIYKAKTADDNHVLAYMFSLQREILKASYRTDGKNDFLSLPDSEKAISVSYASSGQQEVLWITNLLLGYAARRSEHFCVIIEEPEAHLHPDAQYLLIKFIAAFKNMTGSQILLTTHSPYILTSLNNLFYAARGSAKGAGKAISKLIPECCWISEDSFQAFCISDGMLLDIKDQEQAMIDVSILDGVASRQDDEYEQMARAIWGISDALPEN